MTSKGPSGTPHLLASRSQEAPVGHPSAPSAPSPVTSAIARPRVGTALPLTTSTLTPTSTTSAPAPAPAIPPRPRGVSTPAVPLTLPSRPAPAVPVSVPSSGVTPIVFNRPSPMPPSSPPISPDSILVPTAIPLFPSHASSASSAAYSTQAVTSIVVHAPHHPPLHPHPHHQQHHASTPVPISISSSSSSGRGYHAHPPPPALQPVGHNIEPLPATGQWPATFLPHIPPSIMLTNCNVRCVIGSVGGSHTLHVPAHHGDGVFSAPTSPAESPASPAVNITTSSYGHTLPTRLPSGIVRPVLDRGDLTGLFQDRKSASPDEQELPALTNARREVSALSARLALRTAALTDLDNQIVALRKYVITYMYTSYVSL
jgi:hypothetical protein